MDTTTMTVCSMCGDIGFADRLFQCIRCRSRFQHSYCTNYYEEERSETDRVCDWCLREERDGAKRRGIHRKKHAGGCTSETSSDRAEQGSGREESRRGRGKSSGGAAVSRPTARRYKLLKDVLC
ncbi:hypothetical protein OPV22_007271 [Ensete ventricosum]|uniref:PHD-type zinc finger plants domain-containing protein n=1 Tax=Ensete ventricosum TaxID=4639 RepID=A0AAV8RUK0_ENSVE|nr:hypothetical protein OPV22_007271 [Ensete ventricosum]